MQENANIDNEDESQKSTSTISTMNSKNTMSSRMTTVETNMETMGKTVNAILTSLRTIQGSSNLPPVNGETQEKESSAIAVSPTSDTVEAS